MDERIRSILNDESLIANREKWFSEMNDFFTVTVKVRFTWPAWAATQPIRS